MFDLLHYIAHILFTIPISIHTCSMTPNLIPLGLHGRNCGVSSLATGYCALSCVKFCVCISETFSYFFRNGPVRLQSVKSTWYVLSQGKAC